MAKKEKNEDKENIIKETVEGYRDHGYHREKGKEITVFFLDGTSMTGKLNYIGKYELFLLIQDKDGQEEETTIFKNAIKYTI